MASQDSPRPSSYCITSPRLVIRSPTADDAEAVCKLLTTPENQPFDEVNTKATPDDFRRRIEKWAKLTQDGVSAFMVVVLRESNEVIGFGGFNSLPHAPALDRDGSRADDGARVLVGDTGITLDRRHCRRGYATEAMCATVEFGFRALGCGYVHMDTGRANTPFQELMRSMGFEGVLKAEDDKDPIFEFASGSMTYDIDERAWSEAREVMKSRGKWPL